MAILPEGDFSSAVFNAHPTRGPWQSYNFSPESRTLHPKEIYATEGSITGLEALLKGDGTCVMSGEDALATFDFGVNTAGLITLDFGARSSQNQRLGLAFSESKQFIGRSSDRSMDFAVEDSYLSVPVNGAGRWTCPPPKLRGAFRYLTIYMLSSEEVELCSVSTYNNMMPSMKDDLRNYSGYFYSNDDFLNKMWYAGAYTVQISTIPTMTGRRCDWVRQKTGWFNDVASGPETAIEVLCDGAKRDRSVWSGDRGISEITNFIAFNNSGSVEAGVDFMFEQQLDDGQFPYAAKPIWHYGSDSYHLWTLIALHQAYFYNGGKEAKEWVRAKWAQFKKAVNFSLAKVDETGMLKVSLPLDWGRNLLEGHNLQVNCLLYFSLLKGAELAKDVIQGDEDLASQWSEMAASVKKAVNAHLWSEKDGLYRDFIDSEILPQDGNALAIWYGITDSPAKTGRISASLPRNWTPFGAVAPESPKMISPFCSSMEMIAHFTAKQPNRAMELLRTMWGYMWNAEYSVQSSLIEGYYHDGRCHYPFVKYDPSYISHAHPWASGPTIVLTQYLVGLRLDSATHDAWTFEPQPDHDEGGVQFAMSGVTSAAQGIFSAGWTRGKADFDMAISAPENTIGLIGVPYLGKKITKIEMDEKSVDLEGLENTNSHMYLRRVNGGRHTVKVWYH